MLIIDTKEEIKRLSGDDHPSLKIGDKIYTVDDRKTTYDKIQELSGNDDPEKDRKIIELAVGKEAADEITEGITVRGYTNLSYFIMAAITGEDYEELKKRANENIKN